jgi:hypothetical protein
MIARRLLGSELDGVRRLEPMEENPDEIASTPIR